jgi:hypothetical protein
VLVRVINNLTSSREIMKWSLKNHMPRFSFVWARNFFTFSSVYPIAKEVKISNEQQRKEIRFACRCG